MSIRDLLYEKNDMILDFTETVEDFGKKGSLVGFFCSRISVLLFL